MTYERRSNNFRQIRQDLSELGHECPVVFRQWGRLAWYAGVCLVLTIRLVLRIAWWTICFLTPISRPAGTAGRRRPTGMAIPAFDVMLLLFGAATLIGHLW